MKPKIIPEFYLIFGLLFVFVAGCILRVIIAFTTPSQLLTADYYEQSLRFDRITDARQRAEKLSMDVSFLNQNHEIVMTVTDPQLILNVGESIQVKCLRPADKDMDSLQVFHVSNKNNRHSFTINHDLPIDPGLWIIHMTILSEEGVLMFEKKLVV